MRIFRRSSPTPLAFQNFASEVVRDRWQTNLYRGCVAVFKVCFCLVVAFEVVIRNGDELLLTPFIFAVGFVLLAGIYGATWLLLRLVTRWADARVRKVATYACVLVTIWFITLTFVSEMPRGKFSSYVVEPVPPSVKNIRSSDFSLLQHVRVILKCDIQPSDFDLVVEKRGFEPAYLVDLDWVERLSIESLGESISDVDPVVFFRWNDPSEFPSTKLWMANQEKTKAIFVYTHDN